MAGQPFRMPYTVTLDAYGEGEVSLQPPGVVWDVTGWSVKTSTATLHPRANIEINGGFVEGTWSGHQDTSNSQHRLGPTDVVRCTWTGGDVGARATLLVWGKQYIVGREP